MYGAPVLAVYIPYKSESCNLYMLYALSMSILLLYIYTHVRFRRKFTKVLYTETLLKFVLDPALGWGKRDAV